MKQAMIFAAGLGTRLKPLTDTNPKALVRVGGEPLLKRVALRLRSAGFTRVVVNVHHFAPLVIEYLKANNNFGLDIRISDETNQLLDTGGGLRKAASLFDPNYPILIHNVDILSNVNLAKFYALDTQVDSSECDERGNLPGARLLVSWRQTQRYLLFNDQMHLVGWVNIKTGEVKSPFPEVSLALGKLSFPLNVEAGPQVLAGLYHAYAFSGIHSFSPRMFPRMEECPDKFPIMDFYLRQCGQVPIKGYVKHDLRLMDVGKLNALDDAETFARQLELDNNNNNHS